MESLPEQMTSRAPEPSMNRGKVGEDQYGLEIVDVANLGEG